MNLGVGTARPHCNGMATIPGCRFFPLSLGISLWLLINFGPAASAATGRTQEIRAAKADDEEEFERLANALQPGDELILHGGTYSQKGRRTVTAKGALEQPIIIRAATGEAPLFLRQPSTREVWGQRGCRTTSCMAG